MIELGASKPPESFDNPEEHRGQIARYVRRMGDEVESSWKVVWAGTITTTASSASTIATAWGSSDGDAVILFPADAIAAAMTGVYATVSVLGISMTHPIQVSTGVFNAVVVKL